MAAESVTSKRQKIEVFKCLVTVVSFGTLLAMYMLMYYWPTYTFYHQSYQNNKSKHREVKDKIDSGIFPSLLGTPISPAEILRKLQNTEAESKVTNKECQSVHAQPTAYWRPEWKGPDSTDTDVQNISLAWECLALNYVDFMAFAPRGELFPWEQDYLSQPPLIDLGDSVSADRSKVKLLGNQKQLHVGDTIKLDITLYNVRGTRRKLGGDILSVWLSSPDINASMAADITDNKDGSYLATSLLPWSGSVQVKVMISHSREVLRTQMLYTRVFKTIHGQAGVFECDGSRAVTPCMPFPSVPGYAKHELCNLTESNGGSPWYCGRHDILRCCNQTATITIGKQLPPQPLTRAERVTTQSALTPEAFIIPENITLQVYPARGDDSPTLPIPARPCTRRDLHETFLDSDNKAGYFYKNQWIPLACHLLQQRITPDVAQKCFQNTKVVVLGDSNARKFMLPLSRLLRCELSVDIGIEKWHAPLSCELKSHNASVQLFVHENPFYGSPNEFLPTENICAPAEIIDSIPSHGKYLVFIHVYLHLIRYHLAVAETRLLRIRSSVQRLLARNPHVMVIIQSPHEAYAPDRGVRYHQSYFLLELYKTIFQYMGDRVMLGLTWPMSIAKVNYLGHPEFKHQFLILYLGYFCGRKL